MSAVMQKAAKPSVTPLIPTDERRARLWRRMDRRGLRQDLQVAIPSARSTARSPVARIVADGNRNSYECTDEKAATPRASGTAGTTSIFMDLQIPLSIT